MHSQASLLTNDIFRICKSESFFSDHYRLTGLMLKEVTSSQPQYNLPPDSQTSPKILLIQAAPIGYLSIFQMLPTFSAHDLP